MTLTRNHQSVIAGHLLQHTTLGKSYVATRVRLGHVTNWAIVDDRGDWVTVSNNARRQFFLTMKP